MNRFIENKYYIMTYPGESWGDYDGPFDTQEEAVEYLKIFINEQCTFSPEMLGMVVTYFKDSLLDLVKVNGSPLDGEYLYQKLGKNS